MANRTVVLYQRIKIKKKWAYRTVPEELTALVSGEYYLSWYEGSRKSMDPVGSDPEVALAALNKKRLELAYVAAGGKIKESDSNLPTENGRRKRGSALQSRNTTPTASTARASRAMALLSGPRTHTGTVSPS